MLDIIINTITVIGFTVLLIFAWIGFRFVAQAFSFAAELQLIEYKYNKAKGVKDEHARHAALNKLKDEKEIHR